MKARGEKLLVRSCLSLIMSIFQEFCSLKTVINNWYSTATHYAKCDVISGQNKKFKLKYLINKTLERKSTKELDICITVFKVLSHDAIKIFVS